MLNQLRHPEFISGSPQGKSTHHLRHAELVSASPKARARTTFVMLNSFQHPPRQEHALSTEILKQVQEDGCGLRTMKKGRHLYQTSFRTWFGISKVREPNFGKDIGDSGYSRISQIVIITDLSFRQTLITFAI